MTGRDILIEIDSVDLSFRQNSSNPLVVFKNLSLDIRRGELAVIVGPSGCGKTTLLRLVGDLLKTTNGTILIGGHTPQEARKSREFSFVFQNPVLLPWRTVRKNVELAGEVFHDSKVRSRAQEFINLVGLSSFENAYPGHLSGGMQSRVAIARALTFNPKVLLMDEPFADLDELTRFRMNIELLRVWQNQKTTVLFVTHSLRDGPQMLFDIDISDYLGKVNVSFQKAWINGGPSEKGGTDITATAEDITINIMIPLCINSMDSLWSWPDPGTTPVIYVGDVVTLIPSGGTPPYIWEINPGYELSIQWQYELPDGSIVIDEESGILDFHTKKSTWMDKITGNSIYVDFIVADSAGQSVKAMLCIEPRLGNVDGSGAIDEDDARLVIGKIARSMNLPPARWYAADVTGLGGVSCYDAALILQYSYGIIGAFPTYTGKGAPSKNPVPFAKLIAQLRNHGEANESIVDSLEDTHRLEQNKLRKRLPTSWGSIKGR